MRILAAFLTALCGLLYGCASISDKAAGIQVHTQISSALDKCKKIGPVSARVTSLQLSGPEELSVKLREAVADQGGDTLVLLNLDETLTELRQQGIAYRCY